MPDLQLSSCRINTPPPPSRPPPPNVEVVKLVLSPSLPVGVVSKPTAMDGHWTPRRAMTRHQPKWPTTPSPQYIRKRSSARSRRANAKARLALTKYSSQAPFSRPHSSKRRSPLQLEQKWHRLCVCLVGYLPVCLR